MKGTFDEKDLLVKLELLSMRKKIIPNSAYNLFKVTYNSLTKKRFVQNIHPVTPARLNRTYYA